MEGPVTGLQSIFALVVVLILGLALLVGLQGPAFQIGLGVLLMLTALGSEQMLRRARAGLPLRQRAVAAYWVLPTLLMLGAALFLRLPFFNGGPLLGLGLLLTALLLLAVLRAEYHQRWPGPFSAEFVSYIVAFALFSALYAPRLRSLFSATAIAIVTALLTVELLRRSVRSSPQAWLYAAVIGLSVGELTWVLNYWMVGALAGGLALLLAFYTLVSLAQHALTGQLTRQVGIELGLLALAGAVVVLGGNLWLP